MFHHTDPEVLVVGAGPGGLVSALFLKQRGVRVEVVDQDQRTTVHSYALATHPRTLRMLDEVGLAQPLIAAGRKVTKVACYEGSERHAEIDYSALSSEHPFLLVVRQSILESIVAEELRAQKVNVRWGHRLEGLVAEGEGLQARVAELDHAGAGYPVAQSVAKVHTLRPAFVIGADGYDSAVRRVSGIEMEQLGAADLFAVFEIEASGDLPAEARVILDPDATSVYWPLEEGRCRWGFQIRNASEHVASKERFEQLVAARALWFTAQPKWIIWSTLALFARRLARRFGDGRVWLAGDAAHQAAPIGVHSLNSGLAEARQLAMRIARIQHAAGSPLLLRDFADETHKNWHDLLGSADKVRVLPTANQWVQRSGSRILECVPASGEDLEPLLGQIGLSTSIQARGGLAAV